MRLTVILLSFLFLSQAFACPWKSVSDVGPLDYKAMKLTRSLSASEVLEDLSCLNFLYKNAYVATEYFLEKTGVDITKFEFEKDLVDSAQSLFLEIKKHHKNFKDFHFNVA